MIPFYRILEVSLYALLRFMPYLFISLYPFRKQLRFSRPVTGALIGLLAVLEVALCLPESLGSQDLAWLAWMGIGLYGAFYFLLVKEQFGKLFFTFLSLLHVAIFVTVFSKCLEGILFGPLAREQRRWSFVVSMVLGNLIFTLPVYWYVRKQYFKVVSIQTSAWRYLWVIPATFCMMLYSQLYMTGQSSQEVALDVKGTMYLLVNTLGKCVIYHIGILQLLEQEKVQTLEQQNQLLDLKKLHYTALQSRINEARQAKHDVRHHTHLIREYLRSGKLKELEEYLDHYTASLPDSQSLVHCQHEAVNTLLGYFVQQARSSHVEMDVFVQLPEKLNLSQTTLSVVLGNLLENAVEACREITEGKKKITVRGKADMGSVFFEITNTFQGSLCRNGTGKFLSTKSENRGLGLESVERLAQAHGGMVETEARDGLFRVSVLLPERTEQI